MCSSPEWPRRWYMQVCGLSLRWGDPSCNLREDPDFVFPSHSKSLQLREDYLWRWFSHSQFRRTGFAAISSLGVFSSPSTSWDHNGVSSCGQRCSEKGAVELEVAMLLATRPLPVSLLKGKGWVLLLELGCCCHFPHGHLLRGSMAGFGRNCFILCLETQWSQLCAGLPWGWVLELLWCLHCYILRQLRMILCSSPKVLAQKKVL